MELEINVVPTAYTYFYTICICKYVLSELNTPNLLLKYTFVNRKQKSIENGIGVVKSQLQNYITECEKIQHLYNR